MEIRVFKTNELFNIDLREVNSIYFVKEGGFNLWVDPRLVNDGKLKFPIRNCDATMVSNDDLIISLSQNNFILHYFKFDDRIVTDIFGLSYLKHFQKTKTEVFVLSTSGNDIYIKTQQLLDVNLKPIKIENVNNVDEEDEDY